MYLNVLVIAYMYVLYSTYVRVPPPTHDCVIATDGDGGNGDRRRRDARHRRLRICDLHSTHTDEATDTTRRCQRGLLSGLPAESRYIYVSQQRSPALSPCSTLDTYIVIYISYASYRSLLLHARQGGAGLPRFASYLQ